MAAVPKQLYRKGFRVKVVTDSVVAAALVAIGYTASEFVDVLATDGRDNLTQAEYAASVVAKGIAEAAERASHIGATGARPVKATAGAGFQFFDTTINKPVFVKADLSDWIDSAGVSA